MKGRLLVQGVRDLFRQPWSLVLTVSAVALTVYLGGLFALALHTLDVEVLRARGQAQFQVYWKPGTDAALVARQWTWMRDLPYLAELRTFTPAQALELMHQTLGPRLDVSALGGGNPLPATALLRFGLPTGDVTFARNLYAKIAAMDGVAEVHFNPRQVDLAQAAGLLRQRMVWPLAAALVLLVALVVGNTVRLSLLRRREEVEILRLVGAGDWYVRLPLLSGAGFLGAVGSLGGMGLLYLTWRTLADVGNTPPLWLHLPFLPAGTVLAYVVAATLVSVSAGALAARAS